MTRALCLCLLFCISVLPLLYHYGVGPFTARYPIQRSFSKNQPPIGPPSPSWSSPYESWYARALLTPHPSPQHFVPTIDSLIFSVYYVAMMGTGTSVSLFSHESMILPNGTIDENVGAIAVDAVGQVLLVSPNDTMGLIALAQEALTMPGPPHNSWSVYASITCTPGHILHIPYIPLTHNTTGYRGARLAGLSPIDSNPYRHRHPSYESESTGGTDVSAQHPLNKDATHLARNIIVNAFNKDERWLERPVEGHTKLPVVLWELFGLTLEGEYGLWDVEKNEALLQKIERLVGFDDIYG